MWELCIDTGGTFTDCWGRRTTTGEERRVKVLSSSALRATVTAVEEQRGGTKLVIDHAWNVPDGFFNGFEASFPGLNFPKLTIVESSDDTLTVAETLEPKIEAGIAIELTSGEEPPVLGARLITQTALQDAFPPIKMRLATTRATNALLERKGAPTAHFTTTGFRDILVIGDQRRKELFALDHRRESPIYDAVVCISGRIDSAGDEIEPLDLTGLEQQIEALLKTGVRTASVALLNSHRNNAHELAVKERLLRSGFSHVSCSSEVAPFIRLLPRAQTALANAYLSPIMGSFVGGVSSSLGAADLRLMTSAGGLLPATRFKPVDGLLSGPAGGIVGAHSAARAHGISRVLTFDMGGTSTDVARVDSGYSYRFEHKVGPVHLLSPALRIETVAAGGGSICSWKPTGLSVGPESAGADPGPACYGKGGPLTLTDVNFLLGRLDPDKVQIPLDKKAAENRLAELSAEVLAQTGEKMEEAQLLSGLIEIADTTMADAIRKVSVREGYDPQEYALLAFGGAGPMHACGIAEKLGITQILVPGEAGLLSAAGLREASLERVEERQFLKPLRDIENELGPIIAASIENGKAGLAQDGLPKSASTSVRLIAEMRLAGQDHPITVDFEDSKQLQFLFEKRFVELFGYVIPSGREIELVSIRVIVADVPAERSFETNRSSGTNLAGPKVIGGPFSTMFLAKGWKATTTEDGGYILNPTGGKVGRGASSSGDAVTDELFRHRFGSIVGDMGELLRLTAISTNIKERLDFSCALLSPEGELVVNAPHIPVHLGALGECVRRIAEEINLKCGDTIITNHPAYGGSHLPDVTLITPVFEEDDDTLLGYVANRAHHAEFGGITPGSMPPGAENLSQEGTVISPTYLVKGGGSNLEAILALLQKGPFPTRRISDNEADLNAQLAANRRGANLLVELAKSFGPNIVRLQMERILDQSHRVMRSALESGAINECRVKEMLDDGSEVQVALARNGKSITIDFSGTSPAPSHPRNLNATPAIVRSAVLYVLRLALKQDLPLNEGLLRGVNIRLPECFLNPPFSDNADHCPAVVGGNVESSQRVVDTLLKALGIQACSQGTMNNLLFGDTSFGYYETIAGGSGAGPSYHGTAGIQVHMTNTATTDPEILESRYPVRLRRFEIRNGSGGIGEFRGGDGVIREFEFLKPLEVSILSQHRKVAPYGLNGGADGKCGMQRVLRKNSEIEMLGSEARVDVVEDDRLIIETPGGGGWGSSWPSPPEGLAYGDITLEYLWLTEANPERGFVPSYHFCVRDLEGNDVGHINLRVGDTEHIRKAAGHIGYTILEPFRGNGFAAQACLALAPWVSEVMGEALITVDPDNLPSIKTIERIGAEFTDEVDVPEGDPHYQRGSVRKRRYRWLP